MGDGAVIVSTCAVTPEGERDCLLEMLYSDADSQTKRNAALNRSPMTSHGSHGSELARGKEFNGLVAEVVGEEESGCDGSDLR